MNSLSKGNKVNWKGLSGIDWKILRGVDWKAFQMEIKGTCEDLQAGRGRKKGPRKSMERVEGRLGR